MKHITSKHIWIAGLLLCLTSSASYVSAVNLQGENATATGLNSIASGTGAEALGDNSVALGGNAKALNTNDADATIGNTVAIGNDVTASGDGAIVIGRNYATASGAYSIAIGDGAKAEDQYATAIGRAANATGSYATAIGTNGQAAGTGSLVLSTSPTVNDNTKSIASGKSSFTIGNTNAAIGESAGVIGVSNTANGNFDFILGTNNTTNDSSTATVKGLNYSMALGYVNNVNGTYAIGLGTFNKVNGNNALALGNLNSPTGSNAVALGYGNTSSETYAVAVGNNNNVSFITAEDDSSFIGGIAVGSGNKVTSKTAAVFGNNSTANGAYSIAIGNSTSLDTGAQADGVYSISLGSDSYTGGDYSTALGYSAYAYGTQSLAIGYSAEANGVSSIAIGGVTAEGADNAVAIGSGAKSNYKGSVALGSNSLADTDVGVTGYFAPSGTTSATWISKAAALSVGNVSASITRQITGVAAGTADTDAVNVAQLKAVAETIPTSVGNTYVAGNGITITDPVDGSTTPTISTLLANNSGLVYDANGAISISIGTGLEIQNGVLISTATGTTGPTYTAGKNITIDTTANTIALNDNITVSSVTADTVTAGKVVSGGITVNDNGSGTITGLTNKTWDANSYVSGRAATEDQLGQVSQSITQKIDSEVSTLHQDINQVGAKSAALAGLQTMQYDPSAPLQFMAAYGGYEGEGALALGVAGYTNDRTLLHAGFTLGSGSSAYNAGVTWKFGHASRGATSLDVQTTAQLRSVVVMQQAQIDSLQKSIDKTNSEHKNEIASLRQEINKLISAMHK